MSRDTLSQWRDVIHISWEKLKSYFKMFNMQFNPIQFIKSQKFTPNQRYIFYEYFGNCLEIANSSVELDFSMLDIKSIYDYLYLNQQSYGYNFFYYNNLFSDEYAYEDMEYEPFNDNLPSYMEAFDFHSRFINKDIARQMNLAFDVKEDAKKYDSVYRKKANLLKLMSDGGSDVSKLKLKSIKSPSGIFLGRLKLGHNHNESFNVRIDYYKQGHVPVLEVKI